MLADQDAIDLLVQQHQESAGARPLKEWRFWMVRRYRTCPTNKFGFYTLIDDEHEQLCATEETQPGEAMNRRRDG
jgi:hypothetical protein